MPAGDDWYVRSRGRTQGPFTLAQLVEMRDRGTLARFHQVSKDQAGWIQAGSLTDLFPAAPPSRTQSPGIEPRPEPTSSPAPQTGAEPNPTDNRPWFYSQAGEPVGPVPFTELRVLAQAGKLADDTLVWNDGLPDWVEAGSVDELRELLEPGDSGRRPIVFSPERPAPGSVCSLAIAGLITGLIALIAVIGFFGSAAILTAAETPRAKVGIVCLTILAIGGFNGLLGTIFSIQAMSRIGRSGGALGGRGLATAGLVMAVLGLVAAILLTVVIALGAAARVARR